MQSFPIGLRAQQNLRFCGRLYIGALRSPLSPFAPSRRSLLVPSPQRPPSPREGDRPQAVEGVPHPSPVEKFPFSAPPGSPVGQALRPCRRLYIGALRSPLSPFAPLPKGLPLRGRGTARRRWKEFPRIAPPYHPSRALLKPLIQPRVQGRNSARFNGGYGVPRGFKGEKFEISP